MSSSVSPWLGAEPVNSCMTSCLLLALGKANFHSLWGPQYLCDVTTIIKNQGMYLMEWETRVLMTNRPHRKILFPLTVESKPNQTKWEWLLLIHFDKSRIDLWNLTEYLRCVRSHLSSYHIFHKAKTKTSAAKPATRILDPRTLSFYSLCRGGNGQQKLSRQNIAFFHEYCFHVQHSKGNN